MTERLTTGLGLARTYWEGVVRPLLDEHAPGIPRAAARVGAGSDVLGLDDVMSRDHDWGLRLQLFVPARDVAHVTALLEEHLPEEFAGHPTRIVYTGAEAPALALDVLTVEGFLEHHLGFDPRRSPGLVDWLSLTGQAALQVTGGEVFEDTDGGLTAARAALAHYPDAVWRYVVACDWQRLDQELPLMERAADRGDELGARIIAGRLAGVAVHLGFTLCRAWPPYPKWAGTLFQRLPLSPGVGAHLAASLATDDALARRDELAAALALLARHQGEAGLPTADPVTIPFWDRPYLQIDQELVDRILDSIGDPEVRALPRGLGGIEQRSDNVDLLTDPARRRAALG